MIDIDILVHIVTIKNLARLIYINVQYGMTSAGGVVHALTGNLSVLHTRIYHLNRLLHRVNWHFRELLHVDLAVFFTDLQVLALLWIEQVVYLILIDLVD